MSNSGTDSLLGKVSLKTYIGIFFIALSTLMYEILLTRIFSVTMGYHFAFMAVSLAMFGMTAGAVIVYLYPQKFPQDNIKNVLAKHSMYFAVFIIITSLIHVTIPFIHSLSLAGFAVIALVYISACIPFVFSGICISIILTRFTGNINKLYAADLIGAALGCILVVQFINISGGPTAAFICALFTTFASITFALDAGNKKFVKSAAVFSLLILLFSAVNTIGVIENNPILRLYWVRGEWANKPLHEKWNSFSRVSIDGDSTKFEVPFAWGLSNTYDRSQKVQQLMLNVDAHSTTVLTKFNGDFTKVKQLEYDVANITQYLRKNSDYMIIGSGAGRDVLSSLYFKQKSILGIEINKDMISAINDDFGGFTGHLDKYPNTTFVGDEARSYIQRLVQKFDVIQVSVIDSYSATSSVVLTENSLYTLETWKTLFEHLNPNGLITVTRFYRAKPTELYKLITISAQTLVNAGVKNPREHLLLLRCDQQERMIEGAGTGTIVMSKAPFTQAELKTVDSVSNVMQFIQVLTPSVSLDSNFALITLANENARTSYIQNFPVNISPPTDDKPYYFLFLKLTDILNRDLWKEWGMQFNVEAISIVLSLFVIMAFLTAACILVPLKMTSKKIKLKGSLPYMMFFAFIGLGFMFVEISQIQRLNIFLGYPTYSIAAALFTLLLASGAGSYFTGSKDITAANKNVLRITMLLAVLIIFGLLTPFVITACRQESTFIRVLVSCVILFPIGFFMGMAFPMGMKAASYNMPQITPWLWGINGVCSVLATVLSIIIALSYGITASYWTGFVCYIAAAVSFLIISKKLPQNGLK